MAKTTKNILKNQVIKGDINSGKYFENIVKEIFNLYDFYVTKVFGIGNFIADFIAEYKNNKYLVEVKYFNSSVAPSHIIDKAVDRLNLCVKQYDEKITPVLIINGIATEKLKETKGLLVIDIANILYLVKDNNELKNQLLSILQFSTDGITPLPVGIFDKPKTVDKQIEENLEKEFIEKLKQWKPTKSNCKEYEDLCCEIVDYLFNDDLLFKGKQELSNDGLYRFDLICKIKPKEFATKLNTMNSNEMNLNKINLWDIIMKYFSSKYIIFEFKNYRHEITQREIYTTEKYLYLKALRGVAIIISCKGADKNAKKAIKGTLRENGKLILSISNDDLIEMLNKKIESESPTDYLEDILDDLLIGLEK